MSDRITGNYKIEDSLQISTISGSVDITVSVEPGDPQVPAELQLHSVSGSIKVTAVHPSSGMNILRDRVLDTKISTTSGKITATIPHGYKTDLQNTSGNINAELHPHGQVSKPSQINLMSASGNMYMTLHPYVTDPGQPLTNLSTTCKGVSGKVKLTYPMTWQGEIEVYMKRGTVRRDWPGLKVHKEGPRTSATIGSGEGKLWIEGHGMNVELVGKQSDIPERTGRSVVEPEGEDTAEPPPPTYEEAMKE